MFYLFEIIEPELSAMGLISLKSSGLLDLLLWSLKILDAWKSLGEDLLSMDLLLYCWIIFCSVSLGDSLFMFVVALVILTVLLMASLGGIDTFRFESLPVF